MKFNVNYYYNQKFLPTKRHRNVRERQIEDALSVSCTELTKEEFPVVFIVHDMQSVQDGMTSYDDYRSEKCDFRMFAEEIRAYKGKLYKPVRITHGAAISTVFEDVGYVIDNLEYMTRKNWYCDDGKEFSESSVIVEDNKKAICQMLRKSAKKYIFCDGKFWSICGEPRYVINTFGLGHNHGGTGFFIEYGYNTNISSKNYFSALQRDEAIAYGKSVALGRGDTESVDRLGKYDNIEVIMPEMVKVNPNKQHGNGCEFMNMMESVISNSSSKNEAGILCVALAMASV